jgi:hypothetical protein
MPGDERNPLLLGYDRLIVALLGIGLPGGRCPMFSPPTDPSVTLVILSYVVTSCFFTNLPLHSQRGGGEIEGGTVAVSVETCGHMARGGHGLPKVSPGPAMLYPSKPCR